jgi:hypothetical protein
MSMIEITTNQSFFVITYLLYVHLEGLIQISISIHILQWNHSSTTGLMLSTVMKFPKINKCITVQLSDKNQ